LGIASDALVYDPIAGSGKKIAAGEAFDGTFKDRSPKTAWAYYIVTPVTRSGIALLGDKDRFVSMGRQRIDQVRETEDGVEASIAFAPGEEQVVLHGFAPAAPRASSSGGTTTEVVAFDANTGEFSLNVRPAPGASAVSVVVSKK
jgi:hypothetical protein